MKSNSERPAAEGSEWQLVRARPCARLAVWGERLWCGLLPLARRRPAAEPPRRRAPVSALAVLHPALFLTPNDGMPPPPRRLTRRGTLPIALFDFN